MRAKDPFHRICTFAALALALVSPMAFSQAGSPDLKTAVDAAWLRSPQGRTLEARRQEVLAGRDAAQSWIAGQPVLGLSQRSDRWTDDTGALEHEVSLSAPIWLPRQQSARRALAQTGADDLEAQIAAARLAVAGEVRERLWAVAAARAALAEARDHQAHLTAFADEVMQRVTAGDLARTDGMLARQEVLAAQGAIAAAQARTNQALTRYRTLTGLSAIVDPEPELVAESMREPHPKRLAARTALSHAQSALGVVNRSRSAAPTVGMSIRRERDSATSGHSNSIGIAVQIPFGTAARNRPLETAALTQIESATAQATQIEAELQAEVELARQQLTAAQQALETASARAVLTREHLALVAKAFRLGERGLADLLRAEALSHEAGSAESQQKVAVGLAHAQLNQALGIVP